MKTFDIIDNKPENVIVETHYYQWLKNKKPTDIHSIKTKIEYLEEQGFKKGEDKLKEGDLFILQSIERTYFDLEIKPKL